MRRTTTALRLRQLRKAKHMSQQNVADFLGITRTAYNKYENGVTQPTRQAMKLAKLFGVSTDFILGVENRKSSEMSMEEMLRKYLALDPNDRKAIHALVEELYQKHFNDGSSHTAATSADESRYRIP